MKKFVSLITALFCVLALSACKKNNISHQKIKIVASCYPAFVTAANIIKDVKNIEITCMNSNIESCFHNYQIQTEDIKNIENSIAFIVNGAGFEPFLEKVTLNFPNVKIIDASKDIHLLEETCDHKHCHGHYNSHTWLSVQNNIKQVENILKGICEVDSKNSEKYTTNANEYIIKLQNLKSQMNEKFEKTKETKIITYHNAFDYLADELGFEIIDTIDAQHDEQPSTKEIAKIIEFSKEKGVKAIFYEKNFSDENKNSIAAKICETITLSTGIPNFGLFSGTSGNLSNDMYIKIMNENIKILEKALIY